MSVGTWTTYSFSACFTTSSMLTFAPMTAVLSGVT